jgi:transposase
MKLVSVESQLAWSDVERMQTDRRSQAVFRRLDYTWAFNDKEVQRVIAAKIAVIACARAIPDSLEKLRALDTLAISRLAVNRSEANRKSAAAAQRVGGLAPYFAALIFRAMRLGEDSVQLASELQVTAPGIRNTLHGLNLVAKQLAAGTFCLCKPMRYRHRGGPQGPAPRWDFKAAIPLRAAGMSYGEIAAKYGMHLETVRIAFVKAGLIFPRARRPRPKAHKFNHRAALDLWREGATYQEIADRFGVDRESVWWAIHKSPGLNITVEEKRKRHRLGGPAPRYDHAAAAEMRKAGISYGKIAKHFGVSAAAVHGVIKRTERRIAKEKGPDCSQQGEILQSGPSLQPEPPVSEAALSLQAQ